jgi:hypothetical protein
LVEQGKEEYMRNQDIYQRNQDILLVEDNADDVLLTQMAFRKAGIE